MHLPDFIDVVTQCRHLCLFLGQHGARLLERPGEIVPVIVHRDVGILRCIEPAALPLAQPLVHPANDVARHVREELIARRLISVHIVFQQFRIVVTHLFEVRHHPPLVDGIPMKPARQLVVNTTECHVLQCGDNQVAKRVVG